MAPGKPRQPRRCACSHARLPSVAAKFHSDEPARILIPYVAFQVATGPEDAGTSRTLQVLYRGVWKSMSALAWDDFVAWFAVRRMGSNFVVPELITKSEAPKKAE